MRGQRNMACFVYILLCADRTLYTGWTRDLESRIEAHNLGKGAKYTRGRRPLELAYTESLPNRSDAQRRESEIKALKRAEKLALINKRG